MLEFEWNPRRTAQSFISTAIIPQGEFEGKRSAQAGTLIEITVGSLNCFTAGVRSILMYINGGGSETAMMGQVQSLKKKTGSGTAQPLLVDGPGIALRAQRLKRSLSGCPTLWKSFEQPRVVSRHGIDQSQRE